MQTATLLDKTGTYLSIISLFLLDHISLLLSL